MSTKLISIPLAIASEQINLKNFTLELKKPGSLKEAENRREVFMQNAQVIERKEEVIAWEGEGGEIGSDEG